MPRVKRGFKRRRRSNKVLDRASGHVLGSGKQFRRAAEAVDRAHVYAYRDRRNRKRDFRQLWISRLSAATSQNNLSYSRFIAALKKAEVKLDRKILSEIAIADPRGFKSIVDSIRTLAPVH